MCKKGYMAILLTGLMVLTSAQLLVSATHNNWITSKYRDGIDDPGHEVPANTVPIPVDTEMGFGLCNYSMTLFSDVDTWHLDDGVPATIHTAPSGQGWMVPFGNSNWVWGSSQTAAGEYTFVRPVQLPAGAYNIEARIQFGVNDFYKFYIQHGDGAGIVSQHLDTDYSHSNSQQGQPTDLWTDDLVDGLNYFIFEANNSIVLTPDGNGVPGTPEGGLMFQIDIIYCREPSPPPPRSCDPTSPYYEEDIYVSNQNETMYRAAGTNDPWALTPPPSNTPPQVLPGVWGSIPNTNAQYVWPQNQSAILNGAFADEQGNWDFKHSFDIPAYTKFVTADFTGLTDNRFRALDHTWTQTITDSIIIADSGSTFSTGNPTTWAIQADAIDDMLIPTIGPISNSLPDNPGGANPSVKNYDLLISSRNRMSTSGNPTIGMLQYELVVKYCWNPPPCNEGDTLHQVQYASDLSVQYVDAAAAMTATASSSPSWAPVYAPTQNAAWANPPAPAQWIWAGGDADGDGVVDTIGQGTYMFRQDFTVPSTAYKFNFWFNGMADNTIVVDPTYGQGSSTDVSIRTQGSLVIPLTSGLPPALNLEPAPSDMLAIVIDHYNAGTQGTQIPPEATALSIVNTDQAWDFKPAPGQPGETDLSLVVFARNRQSSGGSDTAGGLAYTLNVSYCEPPPLPPPCDDGDNLVEQQYVSDLTVRFTDPSLFYPIPHPGAVWAPVSNPINGQNAAWSNPPSTSQWIWSEFDVNGNPLGQGTFVFRHDFTVPQYAYDFSFEFYGMADNLIVANPYWGGVGTDIAIVDQSSLNGDPAFIPNFVEYLSPAPSSMNPNIMNHFNAGTGQTQIPPASSVQAWTLSQETDVSLVVTAHNQMLQAPGFPPTATDGGLAYTLNVSYCDPGLPDDPPPLPVDDDDDDCECSNASVDSEADGLPGFTTPLVLCGLMLAAIVSNRRREIERVTKKIVKRISR